MEISTNGSNYSAVSSTNKINNESNINNTTLSIFEKLIDKSKATDTKTSDYYVTSSVTYEKPTQVKWEDQLIYSSIQLINNEPLKNAVIKTLDSLSGGDATNLIDSIFQNYPENANTPISFQELLKNFGVKLEDLKKLNPEEHKDDKFTFTGVINLKNGADSKKYNNFILDTLVKFFKDRIERFNYCVENTPTGMTNKLDGLKNSVNSLIDNLKKEVDVYNNGFLENQEINNQGK